MYFKMPISVVHLKKETSYFTFALYILCRKEVYSRSSAVFFLYLKGMMKCAVVHIKESFSQRHHRAEPVTPQHLLGQIGAPCLTCHTCQCHVEMDTSISLKKRVISSLFEAV